MILAITYNRCFLLQGKSLLGGRGIAITKDDTLSRDTRNMNRKTGSSCITLMFHAIKNDPRVNQDSEDERPATPGGFHKWYNFCRFLDQNCYQPFQNGTLHGACFHGREGKDRSHKEFYVTNVIGFWNGLLEILGDYTFRFNDVS